MLREEVESLSVDTRKASGGGVGWVMSSGRHVVTISTALCWGIKLIH